MIHDVLSKFSAAPAAGNVSLETNAQWLLERSVLIASRNRHHYVGTEHLLAAILEISDPRLNHFFQLRGVNQDAMRQRIDVVLESCSRFPDISNALDYLKDRQEENEMEAANRAHGGSAAPAQALEYFATHLTDAAMRQKIDPVIGREKEIDRLVQILSRRTKNNPILLWGPGGGK